MLKESTLNASQTIHMPAEDDCCGTCMSLSSCPWVHGLGGSVPQESRQFTLHASWCCW